MSEGGLDATPRPRWDWLPPAGRLANLRKLYT
jgi:hypothetical protein